MTDYEKSVALWRKRYISTGAELAEALSEFGIAFAYHSGKIENDDITCHEVREIFKHDGVTSYTGDLRTLFVIRNSKEANEFLLTAFNEKRAIDETLVRELQRILTQNTYDTRRWQLGERPGEYKRHDYFGDFTFQRSAPASAALPRSSRRNHGDLGRPACILSRPR